jgi:putative DNA primase/helicase
LKADGSGKAEMPDRSNAKKMLGPAKGAAIMLTPFDDVTLGLGLSEEIETGVACMLTGWRPMWVCGNSSNMRSFPCLSGVKAATLFVDHDENGAGQKAAQACMDRLTGEDMDEVWSITPRRLGNDWCDVFGRTET